MPRKKDRHHSKIKHNENTNQQLNQSLFSEIDAKSVEVSGYTLGHGAPQVDEFMKEHTLPTGVVDIDETVILPKTPLKSDHQHIPNTNSQSSQRYNKEKVYLPPITPQHYPYEYYYEQPTRHYPYDYYNAQTTTHHSKYSKHLHSIYSRHQSFHHQYHHRYRECYDPRWWYMPIYTVHVPRSYQFLHHHNHYYTPPKWYELPNRH